jgi:AcrR family transcriptional regulator
VPKVSEHYRESRRDQIIDAAITCFVRRGIRATTMAEIIAESGLSSGAIYGYFDSKQALALAVVQREGAGRAASVEEAGNGAPSSPSDILRSVDDALLRRGVAPEIVIQMWGEATSDPDFSEVTAAAFEILMNTVRGPLVRWASVVRGLDSTRSKQWADTVAPVLLALTQGLVLQKTLIPDFDREHFLGAVDQLFSSQR